MKLGEFFKTYWFALLMSLALAGIAYGQFAASPDVPEGDWERAKKGVDKVKAAPATYAPKGAKRTVAKQVRKTGDIISKIKARLREEDERFEAFFEGLGDPNAAALFGEFKGNFHTKVFADGIDKLKEGDRYAQDSFKKLREDLLDKLRDVKSDDHKEKIGQLREIQKAYWIVEAICTAFNRDTSNHLPLKVISVGMPTTVANPLDTRLVYQEMKKKKREKAAWTFITRKTEVTVYIDQRDLPAFFQQMRNGNMPAENEPEANKRGSRHLVIVPRDWTFSRLTEEEITDYFRTVKVNEQLLVQDFYDRGIKPAPTDAGEAEPDQPERTVAAADIAKILRHEIQIKPEDSEQEKEFRDYLREIRYPNKLVLTFFTYEYNPKAASKTGSKRARK